MFCLKFPHQIFAFLLKKLQVDGLHSESATKTLEMSTAEGYSATGATVSYASVSVEQYSIYPLVV